MIPVPSLQTVLQPFGPQAAHIHFLWLVFLWVCVGVYVLVLSFVALALVRRRTAEAHGVDSKGTLPSKRAAIAVVAATTLTTLILFGLLAVSALQGHALASLRPSDALKIRVTGQQWWWDVVYPDETQPSRELRTANEIHIPVGRTIHVELTSADVIHSFWVPNLHGKTDLLPGKTTSTWLRADKPGIYRGQCAEFCGIQHARMALLVIAQSQEEFDTWYAQQMNPAAEPQNPEQEHGREVFLSTCGVCHSVRGTQAGGHAGPDLTHIADRRTIAAGTLPFNEASLRQWISESQGVKPGNNMPSITLKSADLQAVVNYLEILK